MYLCHPERSRGIPLLLTILLFAACTKKEQPVHDAAMRDALAKLRTAIAHFHDDNGRHPHALDELVPRYLTAIPVDPVTNSAATWRLTTEETVQPSGDFSATAPPAPKPQIIEVHSGAQGADSTGKRWSDY
jgi:general secretion pathway protein G